MSSILEVETKIKDLCISTLYPNGVNNPSIANVYIAIGVGDPEPKKLQADLAAGNANVSVKALPGMERNTTRFPRQYITISINDPTITLTIVGTNIVTVSGTISANQTCMVIVNQVGYAYAVTANDTLNSIAAALAAQIPTAIASGAVITIANAYQLEARMSTQGTTIRELKRQEHIICIYIRAPNYALREAIAEPLNIYFAALDFLPMIDHPRIIYKSLRTTDDIQKTQIYQQELMYLVEYPTVATEIFQTIADVGQNITVNTSPIS